MRLVEGEGICCYFTCVAVGMDQVFIFVVLFGILKGILLFEYKKKNFDINGSFWKIKHRLGGMS
jgi:hypothetical protein